MQYAYHTKRIIKKTVYTPDILQKTHKITIQASVNNTLTVHTPDTAVMCTEQHFQCHYCTVRGSTLCIRISSSGKGQSVSHRTEELCQ